MKWKVRRQRSVITVVRQREPCIPARPAPATERRCAGPQRARDCKFNWLGIRNRSSPSVVRALMFAAAQETGLDVDRLSFTGCFRILQCRLPECDSRTRASLNQWYEALLRELREEQIGPRRNRINPRVIKRKMSKWAKKRPHHRHPKPLLNRIEDCVVMKT